jgi:uracil-DNA glycosylase family 4
MMQNVTSIESMNTELRARCASAELKFECGCGGQFESEIAIIAEAPGEREQQLHEPLVGGSGKFLWDTIRREGITRNKVYITNVVKRMLVSAADANSKKAAISKNELAVWQDLLRTELSLLPNLKYIVVLGSYALAALTDNHAITKLRGSVEHTTINGRSIPVLCTFNPAHIMREPRLEIVFRMDLGKLRRLVDGSYNPPTITPHYNLSFEMACAWLRSFIALDDERWIAYDIECMAGETACIGFASNEHEGVCINFRNNGRNLYTADQERELRLLIATLLANPRKRFVAQNGNFDAYWLWYRDRIRVHHNHFDTMLAHHVLYPGLPHDLGFLTSQYTDHPYYKDEGIDWRQENDISTFWEYNVKDVCITLACAKRLDAELRVQGVDQFFHNHVMRLQPELIRMTVGGILCDTELNPQSPMSLEQASKLQDNYANERRLTRLGWRATNIIQMLRVMLEDCSSAISTSSDEERQLIRRTGIVCEGILAQALALEPLLTQLTTSKDSQSSSPPTPSQE